MERAFELDGDLSTALALVKLFVDHWDAEVTGYDVLPAGDIVVDLLIPRTSPRYRRDLCRVLVGTNRRHVELVRDYVDAVGAFVDEMWRASSNQLEQIASRATLTREKRAAWSGRLEKILSRAP